MTSQRVRIPCPGCRRTLWIRAENLGRRGLCKHCGHNFRASLDDAEIPAARAAAGAGAGDRERGTGPLELRRGVPESDRKPAPDANRLEREPRGERAEPEGGAAV